MRAMVFEGPGKPLTESDVATPAPQPGQLLVRISACGVCRTDLHIVRGELASPKPHLILGHEIVGTVVQVPHSGSSFSVGDQVGIPWLGWTCGACAYCLSGRENLCDRALFTGYTLDGGYAEYTVADERFCTKVPLSYSPPQAAPLLCAGLIGYRALVKAGDARNLGIYGFGAAAHIVGQIAAHQGRSVFAFTRPGDQSTQEFARRLGAVWAGGSDERTPAELDAAIIFAPVGALVPAALRLVRKAGIVVCAGIHMSDIPTFPYDILWGERTVTSVANLTRKDADAFMSIAPRVPVRTVIQAFPLSEANRALDQLENGRLEGAAVLIVRN